MIYILSYFVGYTFQRKRPLFSLSTGNVSITSTDVGITVCDKLSTRLKTFSFNELNEKCFALPLYLSAPEGSSQEWVFVRYLH